MTLEKQPFEDVSPIKNGDCSSQPCYSFREGLPIYIGVSLNGGTPKTPQNDHF